MARTQSLFVCSSCGGESLKWQGQCPHCNEWNALSRVTVPARAARSEPVAATPAATTVLQADLAAAERLALPMAELDRVFGGGLTAGSVTLLGGEPGIGKSTLLLQLAAALATGAPVLYASGEESVAQTAQRARRLGLAAGDLGLCSVNLLDEVLAQAEARRPGLLVVDSIQTMQLESLEGSAGSPQQLRECTSALVRFAKRSGTAVIIVGHVTKEGAIAGPKLLEHLVDTVLYFESDAGSRYRLLRATKNRFGAVNEVAFFAMTDRGLREVRNPSAIFLARGATPAAGSVVMCARDAGRPLLVEVQALVDRSKFAAPRRVAEGADGNRLALLLAVLSRHGDVPLADYDAFVNVVGGLRVTETAIDLPLALALVSSLRGVALPLTLAAFGELGLTGEVRPVAHGEDRLRELQKQGFTRVLLPRDNAPRQPLPGVAVHAVATLREALLAAF